MEQPKFVKVTYFNALVGERKVLVDFVTQQEAEQVLAKFGDEKQPGFYLPETKIEEM